ncbi:Type 1 glutamine amidotransferase-like domain-containing protein [Actinacidiphila glaucinigra]|uniref:Peptidase E n=1 Tax=Actinacidiphila glaucinigra TaxID=235986 RepID=A0A239CFE1_9ACTN|nr:peptidase E [Actinacidiphila glaucinigra]SNS18907.1 Peptidase E [Actinacidiphila glaucinigra]
MTAKRRIVLLGGGFSGMPGTPGSPLDTYLLRTTGRPRPKVCFVPTASGDARAYVEEFHAAFAARDCEPTDLPLFSRDHRDLRSFVLSQDVVYVGGGSTAAMLAVWRVHGLDAVLREAYEAGVLLCGISAGANCWFGACLTDSFGPVTPLRDGLGLLPGGFCPHYDSEPARGPAFRAAVAAGELPAGWGLDDGAAALFTDGALTEVVAERPGPTLHRVEPGSGGAACETALPARLLQ